MNKGEWSEFYTFLRLLADGKLYAADANLQKIESLYYPLVNVIRRSIKHKAPLSYEVEDKKIIIIDSENGRELKHLDTENFAINARKLLDAIKSSSSASFDIPEIMDFIAEIEQPQVKEKSASKRDITVVIHDVNTGHRSKVGFSIKSKIGGASTLFNANVSTNLRYKVEGLGRLEETDIIRLKSLKAKVLVKGLIEAKCSLVYQGVIDKFFESNLHMIDSNFPVILSEVLKLYFSGYSSKLSEIVNEVSKINPCSYKNNSTFPFYKHKITSFLTACALGMTSKKPWNGRFDASGGYIIVKESGEIVCYHLYNWNDFQEYLFRNTFIDTPSTTRHNFGRLNNCNLDLNFQIRFY